MNRTRTTIIIPLFGIPQPFGEFPGWETVAKGTALKEMSQEGVNWRYFVFCIMFVRASDQACIPYGLAIFREGRLPNGRKSRKFLAAFRQPQYVDEFKKQKEKVRQQEKAVRKALLERLITEKKQNEFEEAKKRIAKCFRDEVRYEDGLRIVKNISWSMQIGQLERVVVHGCFHSFDHGATWVGTTCGAWVGANYAGVEAVELMMCGIERHIANGARVCLPTIKHGWLEFIIDPETLINIPAESRHDGSLESAYALTFTTNDRRTWLKQNCIPQANIPAGMAPLILQMPDFKADY